MWRSRSSAVSGTRTASNRHDSTCASARGSSSSRAIASASSHSSRRRSRSSSNASSAASTESSRARVALGSSPTAASAASSSATRSASVVPAWLAQPAEVRERGPHDLVVEAELHRGAARVEQRLAVGRVAHLPQRVAEAHHQLHPVRRVVVARRDRARSGTTAPRRPARDRPGRGRRPAPRTAAPGPARRRRAPRASGGPAHPR